MNGEGTDTRGTDTEETGGARGTRRRRELFLPLVGLGGLLTWQQGIDHVALIEDTVIHNASGVICVVFIAAALIAFALGRKRLAGTGILSGRLVFGCGILMSVLGLLSLLSSPAMVLVCFCLQTVLFIVMTMGWVGHLSERGYGASVPIVAVGGMFAALFTYGWRLAASPVFPIAMECLPAISGCCYLLDGGIAVGGLKESESDDDTPRWSPNRMPWAALVVLCICSFCASFFCGLANDPYLINSRLVGNWTLGITEVTLLVMVVMACGHARRVEGRDTGDADVNNLVVLSFTSALTIMLVIGMLLFSAPLSNTLIVALGIISAVDSCLLALCWIVFSRVIGGCKRNRLSVIAVLILSSGMLYGHYLGSWFNQVANISYSELGVVAMIIVGLVSASCIVNVVFYIREANRIVRDHEDLLDKKVVAEKTAIEQLTVEQMRSRVHAQRVMAMEGYGLTAREQEIVEMLLDGATMAGIADRLCISERTVKFHCSNAYAKVGVHGKGELIERFAAL